MKYTGSQLAYALSYPAPATCTRSCRRSATKAHYGAQLVIVNYYSLSYASALVDSESMALNKAVDGAASKFHVEFADGFGELEAASLKSAGNTCTAGLLTQLGTPTNCGVHPSYAGQALLAQAVLKAVQL